MASQTRSKAMKDIEKDIPSKKRKKSNTSDVEERQKKKSKSDKQTETTPKFPWSSYIQTLKDILEKKNICKCPSKAEAVMIATEMNTKYKIPDITGEIVRTKCRGKAIEKFLNTLARTESPNDEYSSEDRSSASNYSSDLDSGSSDVEDHDVVEITNDLKGFERIPSFWILQNSEHRAYFMSRRLLMRAKQVVGTQSFDIQFTIEPPSVREMIDLVAKKPRSLHWLDCSNIQIQNQIKQWKPISWKVRLDAPPPLVPALYTAEACSQLSWIDVPFRAPVRYTDFGDNQVDIENEEDFRRNIVQEYEKSPKEKEVNKKGQALRGQVNGEAIEINLGKQQNAITKEKGD
jgi:hypothetical protein